MQGSWPRGFQGRSGKIAIQRLVMSGFLEKIENRNPLRLLEGYTIIEKDGQGSKISAGDRPGESGTGTDEGRKARPARQERDALLGTHEELVNELKEISKTIEDNETGLDESIALWRTRGAAIIRQKEDLLASAELKITMLGRD